ncbi:MAG: hypothetical protein RLZZ352_1886 [Pseudomonadota bacterium]|jgi:hypothetical protein
MTIIISTKTAKDLLRTVGILSALGIGLVVLLKANAKG